MSLRAFRSFVGDVSLRQHCDSYVVLITAQLHKGLGACRCTHTHTLHAGAGLHSRVGAGGGSLS
jgi:hypothetical protein